MKAKRHLVREAWVYDDPTEHSAAIAWAAFHKFSLAAFDNYLEGPGWGSPKAQENQKLLEERRAQALDAFRTENHELALAWINFMQAAMQLHGQADALLPLARRGKKHGEDQSRRRKDKPAADPYDADRNDRLQKFHARLVAEGRHDATSATAVEFRLSPRQVRRIVKP